MSTPAERARAAAYYIRNREKTKARVAAHRAANIDKVREYDRNRPNAMERLGQTSQWKASNPEKVYAQKQRRRATKLRTSSAPIEYGALGEPRNECKVFEMLTGERWDIDHVIPLVRGGAHEINNLRPLPHRLNLIKGAKLDNEVTNPDFIQFIQAA